MKTQKEREFFEICASYSNGQLQQMVSQINEFGVYDFTTALANSDYSDSTKYQILKTYLRVSNK